MIGVRMIGVYENRWSFTRYKPILEVSDKGLVYRERFYSWRDVDSVRVNQIVFADGARCIINPYTFRKKGGSPDISFVGRRSQVFNDLHKYLGRKRLEAMRNPRITELEKELSDIFPEIDSAVDNEHLIQLKMRMSKINNELRSLNSGYYESLRFSNQNKKGGTWISSMIIVISILVPFWLSLVRS